MAWYICCLSPAESGILQNFLWNFSAIDLVLVFCGAALLSIVEQPIMLMVHAHCISASFPCRIWSVCGTGMYWIMLRIGHYTTAGAEAQLICLNNCDLKDLPVPPGNIFPWVVATSSEHEGIFCGPFWLSCPACNMTVTTSCQKVLPGDFLPLSRWISGRWRCDMKIWFWKKKKPDLKLSVFQLGIFWWFWRPCKTGLTSDVERDYGNVIEPSSLNSS